jgi:hypothetical protein
MSLSSLSSPRRAGVVAGVLLALLPATVTSALADSPPPINDDYPNTTFVRDLPFGDALDTTGATRQDLDPPCFDSAATVWYTVVADGSPLLLETTGSNYDTTLGVYFGFPSVNNQLTCVDAGSDGSAQATVSLDSTIAGFEYTVMVGAANAGVGGLLRFVARRPTDPPPNPPFPPPNDYWSSPTAITSLPATFTEDVSGADVGGFPSSCGTWWDVWFSYTPTANEHVFFDTMGSDYDTQLGVWLDLDSFPVACNQDALGTVQSRVELDVEAGRTYLIQVSAQFRFGPPTPGTLVFNADRITPFTLDVAVDRTARWEKPTGHVLVSGTVTCSRPAVGGVVVELTQAQGTRTAHGSGSDSVSCDGTGRFEALVFLDLDSPRFLPGRADFTVTAQGTSLDEFTETTATGSVMIRP